MQVQTQAIKNQRFIYQKLRKTCQKWMYLTKQFQNFGFQWKIQLQNMSF